MSAREFDLEESIPPGTVPCRRCGGVAALASEGRLILGEFHGAVCEGCRPALEEDIRLSQLERAGVPPFYRAKVARGPGRRMPDGSAWVLIRGAVGCGKTHAAIEMIVGRPDARFVAWPEVADLRRKHLEAPRTVDDPLVRLKDFRGVLVIDDMGAELVTSVSKEAANLVILARYSAQAQTIITSNLGLSELSAVYGERVASRLSEVARVVELASRTDRRRQTHRPSPAPAPDGEPTSRARISKLDKPRASEAEAGRR
ncbi:MAG: ATP-binding protein [Thermoanaerobaculia bacterium]